MATSGSMSTFLGQNSKKEEVIADGSSLMSMLPPKSPAALILISRIFRKELERVPMLLREDGGAGDAGAGKMAPGQGAFL